MRVLAAQTFHHFLVLLVIALIALVPDETARPLAITLLIVGVQGVVRLGLDLRRAHQARDPHWGTLQAMARSVSPAAAYALCLWLAVDLWDGVTEALGSIVIVVILLLGMSRSIAGICWRPSGRWPMCGQSREDALGHAVSRRTRPLAPDRT
jgi:hypothetical protein